MSGRLAGGVAVGLALVVLIALPLGVRARFEAFFVPSESMEPALLPGDHMLVDKSFRTPQRGDLIVFRDPNGGDDFLVKRVIGLGGESIVITGRQVYVGCVPGAAGCQPLEEPYANFNGRAPQAARRSAYTVPPAGYFVMADNRDVGEDSRMWGALAWDRIVGRPLVIFWSRDPQTGAVRWGRLGRRIHH